MLPKRIVGTNTQYLSTAIRECAGMNFRSLINNYRVRCSLELLRDSGNTKVNFRTFHASCGFLSRSAFYMSFKKETGKTPRQFMRELEAGICPAIICRRPGNEWSGPAQPVAAVSSVES